MRTGLGTSKGELLSVQAQHAELMEWQRKQFPVGEAMGETMAPEAFHCVNGLLPHLHDDLEAFFPKAVVKEDEEETEDVEPCNFEKRGERLGKKL